MNELLQSAIESVMQHIPHDAAWVPIVGVVLLGLFGLVLMTKGARLAPAMAAIAFLGIGGVAGSFLAHAIGTPAWPTIAIIGVLGFALGLALFKIWLAVLVAGCFAFAGLSLYTGRVVAPHLSNYSSSNLHADAGTDIATSVALPGPGDAAGIGQTQTEEVRHLWSYLSAEIPNFQASFWAILLSTGLAGIVFGLLLPRGARAVFAATAGTISFFVALIAALKAAWPAAWEGLQSLGAWGWVVIGSVWLCALLLNLVDTRPRKVKREIEEEAPSGKPVAVG